MGLDMYLYKAKRPEYKKDEEFIDIEWLKRRGFTCIMKEKINELEKALVPYCKEEAVMVKLLDKRQMILDYGCDPDSSELCMTFYTNNKVGYTIYSENEEPKEFKLTIEELAEKYEFESLEDVYVIRLENINYWRKDYELQDYISQMFDYDIQNCEYKKLNIDQVYQIMEYDESNQRMASAIEDETEDCAYFYVEWY